MPEFEFKKFCSHIKNADKDLREMAIFDLHQALNKPSFRLNSEDSSVVVDCVLRCITNDEADRGVRNSAVQVLPALMITSNTGEQEKICFALCSSAASQTARFGEKGYSDSLDSAVFALKLCCELMADRARTSIEEWQRLSSVAAYINNFVFLKLKETSNPVVKDTCYTVINCLLDPFGRLYLSEMRDEMAAVAVEDFSNVYQAHRRIVTCLSLLSPLLSRSAFCNLCAVSFDALIEVRDRLKWTRYVELCEFILRTSSLRLSEKAVATMQSILVELKKRIDDCLSEDDDTCNLIMKFMNSLINYYPKELVSLYDDILDQCISLIAVDPNYCGNANDLNLYDECYIEEVDFSWKLRVGAIEVLISLLKMQNDSYPMVKRLGIEHFIGVNDPVEEVQLATIRLLNVVVPIFRGAENTLLCVSISRLLMNCISGSNFKVGLAAVKTAQIILDVNRQGFPFEDEEIIQCLLAVLRDQTKGKCLVRAEVMLMAQRVIEISLTEPSLMNLAVQFSYAILDSGGPSSPSKINLNALHALRFIVHLAKFPENGLAKLCVTFLTSFLDTKITDNEICRAVEEALGYCMAILSLMLPDTFIQRCMNHLILLSQTDVEALRALSTLAEKEEVLKLFPELIERLWPYLKQSRSNQQFEFILQIMCTVIAKGFFPSESALKQIINFAQAVAFMSDDSALIKMTFRLLKELCLLDKKMALSVMNIFSSLWEVLQSPSIRSCSLHTGIVESASSLLHALCQQLPDQCDTVEKAVLEHIKAFSPQDVNTNLLIDLVCEYNLDNMLIKVSSFSDDKCLVCLCVGTIGRLHSLPDIWKNRLIDTFGNASSKKGQRLSLFGLGRAASNSQNFTLLEEVVLRAASDSEGRDRYWDALRYAAQVAASEERSSFSDSTACSALAQRLIGHILEDNVETTACTLGSLAPFIFEDLMHMSLTHLCSSSDKMIAMCLSLQRYLLPYCNSEKRTELFSNALTSSLQLLKREADVQVRMAALQLFAVIASSNPHFLLTPWMRDVVYPNVLHELREDSNLVVKINLGGYTHREDKGVELRKLAFECVAILLRDTKHDRNAEFFSHCARSDELLQHLIHACSPHEKGEVDENINNQSKSLLLLLVKTIPNLNWTEGLMTSLVSKLRSVIETEIDSSSPDVEKKKVPIKYALHCVMCLSEFAPFVYSPCFHPLLLLAQQSPFLVESMKLSL